MDWLFDLIERFVADEDDRTVARRHALKISGGGEVAAVGFLETARLVGEAAGDPAGLITALDSLDKTDEVAEVGCLVIRCFAAVRVDYRARPDAQAARADLASRADAAYGPVGLLFGADVHAWLVRLVGEAVMQISALAAARAPLVRVETGLSLPSSLIAYDLYGDPGRGAELVARNRLGTPFAMPIALEALAE